MTGRFTLSLAVALGILAGATGYAQGPLEPPGTPGPTMKTIDQVEARTPLDTLPGSDTSLIDITQPGSYYLTADIQGVEAKHGIRVLASDVTIDLNGYTVAGTTGSLIGIVAESGVKRVAVLNGTVRSWGGSGISLGDHSRISRVVSTQNGSYGIYVSQISEVTNCLASENGSNGIALSDGVVADCVAVNNAINGIDVGSASVLRCVSISNDQNGLTVSGAGSVVSEGAFNYNARHGINVGSGGGYLISNNTCNGNGYHGIDLCSTSRVTGNVVSGNGSSSSFTGSGINARCGDNLIEGNMIHGNEVGTSLSGGSGGDVVIRNKFSGNTTNTTNSGLNQVAPLTTVTLATNPYSNILD